MTTFSGHFSAKSEFVPFDFHEVPGAHVSRFFLNPVDRGARSVGSKARFDFLVRQRIKLFDANDGKISSFRSLVCAFNKSTPILPVATESARERSAG